ncbi:MAG: glucosamine-6-phosphate deaminase [Verrucomicrobiales bacterium]
MAAKTKPLPTLPGEDRLEKIPAHIYESPGDACAALAAEVKTLIEKRRAKGKATVLGLATGSTPVPFYRELIRLHNEEGFSFADVITFNLDEYFGVDRDHRESYARFMREQLFDHIDIDPANTHVPDGTVPSEEVFSYCSGYEKAIKEAGGIDLQILGIGRTGHIGFNEPGSSRDSRTRLITLDRITRLDAAADFLGEENVPRFAITMGVGTILEAREIALMAWGQNKASVVAEAVEGPVSDQVSASFLQDHPKARFLIDAAAAGALTRRRVPWLVRPVSWKARDVRRAVVWVAQKLEKPVLKLVERDFNENGLGDLLTQHGPAYDLNIRIFNELQHTISGWPGGKPNADHTNRPERALPYPKTTLVLSPEPQDDVISMGGTMERLHEQGHNVTVAYLTSGNLRVADAEAEKFARVLLATAQREKWKKQVEYAEGILAQLAEKGPFGQDTDDIRRIKSLIRRGEARDACAVCGIAHEKIRFLDLPFYEQGRYRQFTVQDEDIAAVRKLLAAVKPHQIYATGNAADPSSLPAKCFYALSQAIAQEKAAGAAWLESCYLWLYRGTEDEYSPHEIDMAVPMSPDQLARKVSAIHKYQSHRSEEQHTGERNRLAAQRYDDLGLAEYEAIEPFQRWRI